LSWGIGDIEDIGDTYQFEVASQKGIGDIGDIGDIGELNCDKT